MYNKQYYQIPTVDEIRNRRNIQIHESSDQGLYKLYDEAIQGLWNFGSNKELSDDFKKDKDLIKFELKNRGLKAPNWIYEIGLYFHT